MKKSNYLLDKDGYVIISFRDENKKELTLEEAILKLSLSRENRWIKLSGVDNDFAKIVNERKLTKEILLNTETTDLVRGAYYNSYLKDELEKHIGFRPLPLNTYLKNNKEIVRLYPHQIKTLTFMKERENMDPRHVFGLRGGILHLKMGLGKSLIAVSHALISPRDRCSEKFGENGFPTLIISSKTVMIEWEKECFLKFFGDKVKVLYFHKDYLGESHMENITRKQIVKYDFVITTYDVCNSICKKREYFKQILEIGDEHSLMKDKIIAIHTRTRQQSDIPSAKGSSIIYGTPWDRVFLDESQRVSNPKTQTYKYIMAIYGKYKWCLTGTPVRNYTEDIWAQLRFCNYTGITSATEWKRSGIIMMKQHNLTKAILSMDYETAGIYIPKKISQDSQIILTGKEKECYDYILGVTQQVYDDMMKGLLNFSSVLALFIRLRQAAIAPYLITPNSKRSKGSIKNKQKDQETIERLKEIYKGSLGAWIHEKKGTAGIYSTKITEIIDTLKKIPKTEKVIVFSMFTSVLDLLADACKERFKEFRFLQVDGDTVGTERGRLLDMFKNKSEIRGIFMSYKVGSEGLNLIVATHVICIEPWWSPAVPNQAVCRAHRIGQKNIVTVHNVYIQNSIEERILEICAEKEILAKNMLEGTEVGIKVGLDKYTLGRILGIRY